MWLFGFWSDKYTHNDNEHNCRKRTAFFASQIATKLFSGYENLCKKSDRVAINISKTDLYITMSCCLYQMTSIMISAFRYLLSEDTLSLTLLLAVSTSE